MAKAAERKLTEWAKAGWKVEHYAVTEIVGGATTHRFLMVKDGEYGVALLYDDYNNPRWNWMNI